jgi:hydroxyacylglutathione hydrolase
LYFYQNWKEARVIIPINTFGASCFLVGEGKAWALVDSGMSPKPEAILAGLKAVSLEPRDIKIIVLTHAHPDHMGALRAMRDLSGAKTLAHKAEAPFAEKGESSETVAHSKLGRLIARLGPKSGGPGCPIDIAINEPYDLSAFGIKASVIPTPGHTQGSLSAVDVSGEAAVGDVLRGKPGKLSFGIFYSDLDESKRSLEKLLSMGVSKMHFAHGSVASAAEVSEFLRGL